MHMHERQEERLTEAIDKRHAHCLDMSCGHLDHVAFLLEVRRTSPHIQTVRSRRASSAQQSHHAINFLPAATVAGRPPSDYRSRTGVSPVRVHKTPRRRRRRRPPAATVSRGRAAPGSVGRCPYKLAHCSRDGSVGTPWCPSLPSMG